MELTKKEMEFLQHSNYIENEYSKKAFKDARKAWKFAVENKNNFSLEYILEIHHKLLYRLNPQIAGKLRNCAIRIGGKKELIYISLEDEIVLCKYSGGVRKPKPKKRELIKNLNEWIKSYNSKKDIMDYNKIKNLHTDFEYLHPFNDGNGRTGRILMNAQMLNANLPLIIIHKGEEQEKYYKWFRSTNEKK